MVRKEILPAAYAQMAPRAAIFAAGAILSRYDGVSSFAEFSLSLLVAGTLSTLSLLGTGILLTRYIASDKSGGASAQQSAKSLAAMLVAFSVSVIVAVAVAVSPAYLWGGGQGWAGVTALLTFSLGVQGVASGIAVGLRTYKRLALAASAHSGITVAGVILALALDSAQLSVVATALGALVYSALIGAHGSTQSWFRSAVLIKKQNKLGFPLKKVLIESSPIIGSVAIYSIAVMVLGRHLKLDIGPLEFSYYAIAMQIFGIFIFLPNVIVRTTIPRLIQLDDKASAVNSRANISMLVIVAISCVLYPLIPVFLSFYGFEGARANASIAIIMVAAAFASPANIRSATLIATGGQAVWLKLNVLWVGALSVSYFVLMMAGFPGAVAASCSIALAYLLREIVFRTRGLRNAK